MAECRRLLNESCSLVALLLISFAAGVFGAVNWGDYVYPEVPERKNVDNDQSFQLRVEQYHRLVDEVGSSAVIPYPTAVTLCVTGFFGAFVFGLALITRHITLLFVGGRSPEAEFETSTTTKDAIA